MGGIAKKECIQDKKKIRYMRFAFFFLPHAELRIDSTDTGD